MSLEKEIDLISAASLSCFLGSLPEWFATLFLGTGNPGCPQRLKCGVWFVKGLLAAFTEAIRTGHWTLTCLPRVSSQTLRPSLPAQGVHLSLQQSYRRIR